MFEEVISSLQKTLENLNEMSAIEKDKRISEKYRRILHLYKNSDSELRSVEISEKCSACGACMSYSDFFEDGAEGKCVPRNGGIILPEDEEMSNINEAIDLCPEQAISMCNVSLIKESGRITVSDLKKYIEEMLVNYNYPMPQYDDFRFCGIVPEVDGDGIHGWSSGQYSSYDRAQSAGLSELKRVYFNNMNSLMKGLLANYKHAALTPLMSYEEKKDNYYYFENMRMSVIIYALCLEISAVTKKSIDSSIAQISSKPDFGRRGENFDLVIELENQLCGQSQQNIEDPEWYKCFVEIFDFDDTKDTLFGYKTITVYKYSTSEAWHMIEDHMRSGAELAVMDLFEDDYFKRQFRNVIRPIEEEIKEKGKRLLEMLG